jgi:hypothetical protein
MPLLNTGRDQIPLALTGGGTPYNGTNTRLGVGDSTTAYAATQSDLQAVTNKFRKVVDAAPGVSGNVLTAIATYQSGEAQYSWQEFIMANAASGANAFNRLVSNQGTKGAGAVWQLTMTITFLVG